MRQISERRRRQRAERDEVVAAAFKRDGFACQARLLVPKITCRGQLDPHERIPRSVWRDGYLVLANVISVCRAHHDWIDDNPDAAHDVGLHGKSWERP